MENAITKNTAELERLEGIIQKSIGAFYEVGQALMEIRDRGYYKDVLAFETFEAYCRAKWDMGRNYTNKLIASSVVMKNLGTNVPILPVTESQVRPLTRLEPEQQRIAWQKGVETAPKGKITAAHVSKVVREMVGKKEVSKVPDEKAGDPKTPAGKIEESTVLFGLMRLWKEAGEEDRKKFRSWIDGKSVPVAAELSEVA